MQLVLGPTQTCITLPDDFILACNLKTPIQDVIHQCTIDSVLHTIRAWKLYKFESLLNSTHFPWWEAAVVAQRCNNAELIDALQSFVVDKHINGNYNIRIVWTRMQYLSIQHNAYARHHPYKYFDVDELTPLINNPELVDFGRVTAERFKTRLQTKSRTCHELQILAARINLKPPTLSCVNFCVDGKSYVCVGPPHNDCDAALELLKSNVTIQEGVPKWLITQMTEANDTLDKLEQKLDCAIEKYEQLQLSANFIIGHLKRFTDVYNLKNSIINLMTQNIQRQSEAVQALQHEVNVQTEITNKLQDTMDWYVRETDEIKLFVQWKTDCVALEAKLRATA